MKTKMQRAALYLRSSKDRSDVSIDAQRRELQKLAADRGILIVCEFTDVVESAKDEQRAGFQSLLHDLKSPSRSWNTLMMVDTSRLARRRYAAQVFKHEAKKRNVEIIFSKLPETDPITAVLLEAVFEAFDEVHSLMSREKGLAGMAENVRQGYRAGGRAPRGYRLKTVTTGAMREGAQVTKSILEPSDAAPIITRYLRARAGGRSREALRKEYGLSWSNSSLIGMEWNALTYAGHTVWNVHNEFQRGQGYRDGKKHRPRAEWMVQRDTHAPLITNEEAESLLGQLESSSRGKSRRSSANYLLTGLLKTPSGGVWYSNGMLGGYRAQKQGGRSRTVVQELVEKSVLEKVISDMRSGDFIRQLTQEAKRYAAAHHEDPAASLRLQISEINSQISKVMDMVVQMANPGPVLRKIDELEARRNAMAEEIARVEQEHQHAVLLHDISEKQVAGLLEGVIEQMETMQREALKDMLGSLLEQIVFDPQTLQCQLHYRIGVESWNKVASPRRFELLSPP